MSVINTHYGSKKTGEIFEGVKNVFFIGIGGINMSSLALITANRGYTVSGYDRTKSDITEMLERNGIKVLYDHEEGVLNGINAVVYTVAISEDDPYYVEALEKGIPTFSRADYLGYVMTGYPIRVGVSGMHGKSTTTAMLSHIFIDAGNDPTVMCGAKVDVLDGAYRIGSGEDFIFEACEYMDSFLDFYPNIAVILNIEEEHMDYFQDISHIKSSFRKFSEKCGTDGLTVVNGDDVNVLDALKDVPGKVMSYGIEDQSCDAVAKELSDDNGMYSFDVYIDRSFYCHAELSVGGRHNVYNALASLSVAKVRGIDGAVAAAALKDFKGAERRMEYRGKYCGADIYSDYAHHPTEILATLSYAREMTRGKVICVFQPHTYSRLYTFYGQICQALSTADEAWLIDVYAAREVNTYGVDSEKTAKSIGKRARYCPNLLKVPELLRENVSEGDVVIIMGAGNIVSLFDEWKLES